jgi:hypothetical protein
MAKCYKYLTKMFRRFAPIVPVPDIPVCPAGRGTGARGTPSLGSDSPLGPHTTWNTGTEGAKACHGAGLPRQNERYFSREDQK